MTIQHQITQLETFLGREVSAEAILKVDYSPEVYVLNGPTASVAEVVVQGHVYTGSTKLHPNDEHDPVIGEWLAVSRALEAAAKTYKKAAWRRVNAAR